MIAAWLIVGMVIGTLSWIRCGYLADLDYPDQGKFYRDPVWWALGTLEVLLITFFGPIAIGFWVFIEAVTDHGIIGRNRK